MSSLQVLIGVIIFLVVMRALPLGILLSSTFFIAAILFWKRHRESFESSMTTEPEAETETEADVDGGLNIEGSMCLRQNTDVVPPMDPSILYRTHDDSYKDGQDSHECSREVKIPEESRISNRAWLTLIPQSVHEGWGQDKLATELYSTPRVRCALGGSQALTDF